MKKLVFVSFIVGSTLGAGLTAFAEESVVGLPASKADGIGTRPADDSVRIVGQLPYSNQWTFEKPSNYLYLNYDTNTLAVNNIKVGNFDTQYGASKLSFVSIDFFSKLVNFADPEGSSFMRKFSLWGRYKLGLGMTNGTLVDSTTSTTLTAEKNSLFVVLGQIELNVTYDWLPWIQPFLGFSYKPYYFRSSSSMPGAESEGQNTMYGPSLGVHLPLFFDHRGTLFAEVHQDMAPAGGNQLFVNQLAGDFGAGLAF